MMNMASVRGSWPSVQVRLRPSLAAGLLAAAAMLMGWRGEDWAAQLYRAELFDRVGFAQWDNFWYGGHSLPSYSLMFPPLGALVGVPTVVVLSSLAATWAFADVAHRFFVPRAARVAVVWFVIGTSTNALIGRATFALGLVFGLVAIAALLRGSRWAVVLALLAPLASPVAGVFVAIASGAACAEAVRKGGARWLPCFVTVGALTPIAVLSLLYPDNGRFPYRFGHASVTIGVCVAIAWFAPRAWPAVRTGALLYAAIAVAVFVVANPLGGNVARLAMLFGGPLLAGLLLPNRWITFLVLGAPVFAWQWMPAFDSVARGGRDPSVSVAYHQPLLDFLQDQPFGRVEIPFTERHWETRYIAPHVPLARGWERQVDMSVNKLFYEPGLTAGTYHQWLVDNAISFVALPDVDLDASAIEEAALLRTGVPGLVRVWNNAQWQVWQVTETKPLVEGPARLLRMEVDSFTLDVAQPGDVLVRVRHSPRWQIDGESCVASSPEGWTKLTVATAGEIQVRQAAANWLPLAAPADGCPG